MDAVLGVMCVGVGVLAFIVYALSRRKARDEYMYGMNADDWMKQHYGEDD